MEKEIKKLSADSLTEYVNKQRTQEECIGFIDGFAEAVRLLKKHGFLTDVSGCDDELKQEDCNHDYYDVYFVNGDCSPFSLDNTKCIKCGKIDTEI